MTDILPPAGWPSVRQLETNEFASGGANGNMNEQAKSLAARSELLKRYAALPYESKTGGYALNEYVQLATGDIVRSTIPSNVKNPNVDMTGWVIPYLVKSSNLSDVPDKAVARTNLGVYSTTQVDTAISNSATPAATELVAGKAKIATTAIAQAGVNDADFLTPKKLRDALSASGEAPISAIRSYVIGSATGAPTILRSMNVASVSKPASSQLTVNFIKPMTDTNYIVLAYAKNTAAPNEQVGGVTTTKTVNSCTINFRAPGTQSDNAPEYTVVIL